MTGAEESMQKFVEENFSGIEATGKVIIGYAAEEEMYAKVREMLTADECVMDPIGRLIDRKRFQKMTLPERDSYVLELAKIYARLKERYYREKKRRNQ